MKRCCQYAVWIAVALIPITNKVFAQLQLPIDKKATSETIQLYNNLKKLTGKGFMFGHQDDLAYGVNWKYIAGKSDIKDVTGDYPAIYGWELGHLELDSTKNLDDIPFNNIKQYIKDGYARGGVITISWHFTNAVTGKSAWDATPGTVAAILPGGAKHELYKSWLNKLAAFMLDLKTEKGVYIPVIFRPFHELTGSWFWWGKNLCTPDELKKLFQFTTTYLRDVKNIHHLLYAYNTSGFADKKEFLERYPGNDWADLIGFDAYQSNNDSQKFINELDHAFSMLDELALETNKIPALMEIGYNEVPDKDWWTGTLLKAIGNHKISYALTWRNAGVKPDGKMEYFAPFIGQVSATDFVKFYKDKKTLFQNDVKQQKLYH